MTNENRIAILAHTLDYLKLKIPHFKIEKKGGKTHFTCPFWKEHKHSDADPSCNFIPNTYQLYCWIHKKIGDIFDVVRKLEKDKKKWSDNEIAYYLNDLLQLNLTFDKSTSIKTSIEKDIEKLVKDLVEQAHKYLFSLSPKHPVKKYLKKRGITKDIAETFKLGYLDLTEEQIKKYSYLLQKMKLINNEGKKLFDDNILFPIFENEVLKGFQLRHISQDSKKRYLTYTITGFNFYSLNSIDPKEDIYVVEGIPDYIALYKEGKRNIIALLTNATNKWYYLKPKSVVFVPDNDDGGESGLIRSLRSLIKYKDVSIKVVRYPSDFKDIDEFINSGGRWQDVKEVDLVYWGLENFEERKEFIFEYIANKTSEIEKEKYIQILKKELKVKKEVILKDLEAYDPSILGLAHSTPISFTELIDKWYEKSKNRTEDLLGLKSLPEIDRYFYGLQEGIWILLANPTQGKSLFAINWTIALLENNKDVYVVYYSIDDSIEMTLSKLVCAYAKGKLRISEVRNQKLIWNNPELTQEQKEKKIALIDEAVDFLKQKANVFSIVWDEVEFEKVKKQMIDVVNKLVDKKVVFVFDSVHNIMNKKGSRDESFFSTLATFLLNFSNMYKVPIIATCHTPMNVTGDISGRTKYSGELVYHARVELDLELDREPDMPNGILKITCSKNKVSEFLGELLFKVYPLHCYLKGDNDE